MENFDQIFTLLAEERYWFKSRYSLETGLINILCVNSVVILVEIFRILLEERKQRL
jgi:hypothetical protein